MNTYKTLTSFLVLFFLANISSNDSFPLKQTEYSCSEKIALATGENGVTDKISPTSETYYLDMDTWKKPTFGLDVYGLTPKKTTIISSTRRGNGNWVGAYSIETPYNPEILTLMYDKEARTLGAVVTTAQGKGKDHYVRNSFYYCYPS